MVHSKSYCSSSCHSKMEFASRGGGYNFFGFIDSKGGYNFPTWNST